MVISDDNDNIKRSLIAKIRYLSAILLHLKDNLRPESPHSLVNQFQEILSNLLPSFHFLKRPNIVTQTFNDLQGPFEA